MTTLDMTPGAQIPRTDAGPQTAVTQALSSAAYRDGEVHDFVAAVTDATAKKGRFALFRPNLGEAFSRAVIGRALGGDRKPLVPSFGIDTRQIVEHCLAAEDLRAARDRKLTSVTVVTGVLFLPGTLLWLGAFQLRAWLKRDNPKNAAAYGGIVLALAAALALLLAIKPPAGGLLGIYLRLVMLAPVVGWYLAKRIVLASALDLRARWLNLVEGNAVAATVPMAVPRDDLDKKAADLRAKLGRLESEQETNIQHYAGRKGILGVGKRWGEWRLVDNLRPAEGHLDYRAFHPWDLVRKISGHIKALGISDVANSGIPGIAVKQWVVLEVGEGADEIGRPGGADMDGDRMREFAIQAIADKQTFPGGPRHYLATQFVTHDGKLVITFTVTVVLLAHTMNITVAGYALGPVNGLFFDKPKDKEKTVPKTVKFWEEQTLKLPLIDNDEVVRQAVRAPFHRIPGLLAWLGGGLGLPEPFGFRHAWAAPPWNTRSMTDNALNVASPVLSAVHAATLEFLEEHDLDTERFFKNRASIIKSEAQGSRPYKVDQYDAG
ncbi:hypothetical protein EH183_39540 [Streptomyces sp. CB01881]|uniref:hypothetical protein n=1 Tax=Streptomyces sp. CB01881 TaxID=2078691 RepID=UPI0011DF1601|nr:hypothetical protein [Streptomyces sp. CB01881]TYC68400.1 hypothetical protein EH183_39540 [Streptomyces sp. CB01881]